ncbi:restriction endonuclease subunit S [Staphylococcus felis]|uniref:Restriction endonuclease subunit S n=1 Tax=Staphylococcus felis TaxID=46127 RepID=A0A3E0IL22_9STAP|nr:restriction endonuclease subunit S [Staphylococcus felis]REH87338.1 restriction endonuclease subunit S [Staphylococcus felis]REH89622.1 restriction endonuclease subunit S [Staphylococcus felis]
MEFKKIKLKFADFIELKRGYDLPSNERNKGCIPIISSSGKSGNHNIAKVKGPGVITGRSGLIGAVHYESADFWPLNTTLYVKDFKGNSPEYVYYFLKNMNLKNFSTGSSVPTLNRNHLNNIEISIHDTFKQLKQIKLLVDIDKKIDNNKQIIENLEELSQTLFKRWFVDFEFPDENGNPYKSSGGDMVESELSKIPKSWKVDTLGNYIKIKSGKRPKCKVDNKDFENVVPVIGASKIMGYTNDYIYNEKIIIIGRVGTHGVIQRFSTRTWPSDNTFVITSDFESIIYQLLKSIDYISLNRGSTQPLLSQKDIKNTKVAMPTNETLLYKYQNENDHILKMMDQKNIENQKLAQLRDTLLPKLMSGEIEIPDDIEVMEDELSI